MREVFADTFFWSALVNARDTWHSEAQAAQAELSNIRLVTTDEVLTEFATQLGQDRRLRVLAARFVRHILRDPSVRVIPQNRESFLAGLKLYEARPDKTYSLTDCISMSTMAREQLTTVLTYDRHFEQEGFEVFFR